VALQFEDLKPGVVLAQRYELIEFLGAGAYGVVFKAYDKILETLCCVKVLSPEASADRDSRERFRREILLARRVAHRNCCQIFDLGVSDGLYYILMEFVDGLDLSTLIKQKQTIGVRDTLSIAYQICSALRAAHEVHVIHRDLKPQNIMVTRAGIAKIMDFGIAKAADLTQMTRVGTAVGTPSYMSPEQCKGLPADPRSDLYSLGVVLFTMLTGAQPFKANSVHSLIFMHISDPPPRPSALNPEVPAEVEALVLRCLEKEPDRRFQSAVEMRRAIAEITHALGTRPEGRVSGMSGREPQRLSEAAQRDGRARRDPEATAAISGDGADALGALETAEEEEAEDEQVGREVTALVDEVEAAAGRPAPRPAPVPAGSARRAPVPVQGPVPPARKAVAEPPAPGLRAPVPATLQAERSAPRPEASVHEPADEPAPRSLFKLLMIFGLGGLLAAILVAGALLFWLGLLDAESLRLVRRLVPFGRGGA
jgi:hypothetical protein